MAAAWIMGYRKGSMRPLLPMAMVILSAAGFLVAIPSAQAQPNRGFAEPRPRISILQPGEELLRYRNESGNYLTRIPPPPGLPRPTPDTLALGPRGSLDLLRRYRVLKPFQVEEGTVRRWHGQSGGANQIFTYLSVEELVHAGYLEEFRPPTPRTTRPGPPRRGTAALPIPEEPPYPSPLATVNPWLVPVFQAVVVATGLSQKKRDGFSVPQPLLPFPPSTPSTHLLNTQTPVPSSFNVNGTQSFTAGGFVGYNWRFGNVVVGVEGDAAWKRFSASNSDTVVSTATYGPNFSCNGCTIPVANIPAERTEVFSGQVGQNWDASLRARLGTFITPSIMTYITGGAAFGNVNGSFSYSGAMSLCNSIFPTPPCTADSFPSVTQTTSGADSWSETRVGWTMGSGIETQLGGGWKVRLEYRYTDLGSIKRNVPLTRTCTEIGNPGACGGPGFIPGFVAIPNGSPTFVPITQQAAFQTLRFGIVYSFNGFDLGANLGGSWD
jgi:opacity protein-like surface antigen